MGALRLFLAVSVLVTHLRYGRGMFGLSFLHGQLAVECFFVISGFYMALVLNGKYNYKGSYWPFVQQRFLRLYPLYFVVGILILIVDGLITHYGPEPIGIYKYVAAAPVITPLEGAYYTLINLTILGLDSLWFLHQDLTTGVVSITPYTLPHMGQCINFAVNVPTWTLGIEMTFYLVAPFLVRKSVAVQATFMLISFVMRSAFWLTMDSNSSWPWTYCFSPSLLFFFMAGSLGCHFYRNNRAAFEQFATRHAWMFWVFFAFMIDERRLPFKDYYFFVFTPVAIVMVPLLFAYTRNNKWDRMIGELSYPFYLIHFTVIAIVELILHENYNSLFGPLSCAISLGLTYLLYRFVELKTEAYRERIFEKHHAPNLPAPGGS